MAVFIHSHKLIQEIAVFAVLMRQEVV